MNSCSVQYIPISLPGIYHFARDVLSNGLPPLFRPGDPRTRSACNPAAPRTGAACSPPTRCIIHTLQGASQPCTQWRMPNLILGHHSHGNGRVSLLEEVTDNLVSSQVCCSKGGRVTFHLDAPVLEIWQFKSVRQDLCQTNMAHIT